MQFSFSSLQRFSLKSSQFVVQFNLLHNVIQHSAPHSYLSLATILSSHVSLPVSLTLYFPTMFIELVYPILSSVILSEENLRHFFSLIHCRQQQWLRQTCCSFGYIKFHVFKNVMEENERISGKWKVYNARATVMSAIQK